MLYASLASISFFNCICFDFTLVLYFRSIIRFDVNNDDYERLEKKRKMIVCVCISVVWVAHDSGTHFNILNLDLSRISLFRGRLFNRYRPWSFSKLLISFAVYTLYTWLRWMEFKKNKKIKQIVGMKINLTNILHVHSISSRLKQI